MPPNLPHFIVKTLCEYFPRFFSRSYCIPQLKHDVSQGAALEEMNEELTDCPTTSASRVVFGPSVHVADNVSSSSWCPSEVYSSKQLSDLSVLHAIRAGISDFCHPSVPNPE